MSQVSFRVSSRLAGSASHSATPRISVVIPTRNRPRDLLTCATSVLALDYPNFEVIIVDQSPSDDGEKLLSTLDDKRLRVIRTNSVGRSRGANLGIQSATGSIVAFTDDDVTVPSGWLNRLAVVFAREPDLGVYYGAVNAAPHNPEEVLIPAYVPEAYRVTRGRFVHAAVIGMGANMAARRRVLKQVGGFDDLMGVGSSFRSGEDWEVAYRTLRAGYSIVEDPETPLTHYGARPLTGGQADSLFMNYLFGHGAGYCLNMRKGDLGAAYLLVRELLLSTCEALGNIVKGHRPLGIRRILAVMNGAWSAAFCKPEPSSLTRALRAEKEQTP